MLKIRRFVQLSNVGCIAQLNEVNGFRFVKITPLAASFSSLPANKRTLANKRLTTSLLEKLEYNLLAPGIANPDVLLNDINAIHKHGAIVPLSHCLDIADLLAFRHDATRMELLIQIASVNFNLHVQELVGTRSQPIDHPLNKLISHAIAKLFVNNNANSAMELWVRMASEGYLTSRSNLELLFDLIIKDPKSRPTITFLDNLHASMTKNLWNQSPEYYLRIMGAYKQYLWGSSDFKTIKDVRVMTEKLDNLWDEAHSVLSLDAGEDTLNLELYALRAHCWASVVRRLRKLKLEGQGALQARDEFVSRAMAVYQEFIEQSRLAQSRGNQPNNVVQSVTEEVRRIFASINETDYSPAEPISTENVTVSSVNVGDRKIFNRVVETRSPEQMAEALRQEIEENKRIVRESVEKYFIPETALSRAAAPANPFSFKTAKTTFDRNVVSAEHAPTAPNEFMKSTRLIRLGISDLPIELAKQGKLNDALTLFESYLVSYSNDMSEPEAKAAGDVSVVTNQYYAYSVLEQEKPYTQSARELAESLSLKTAITGAQLVFKNTFDKTGSARQPAALGYWNDSRRRVFYSEKDKDFFEYVLCEIMRGAALYNNMPDVTDFALHANKMEHRIFSALHELGAKCEQLAIKYDIPLTASFFAAHIDAIGKNANAVNRKLLRSETAESAANIVRWESSLAAVFTIVDSLPDHLGRSPALNHAVIRMLCQYEEPAALFRALHLLHEMSDGDCKVYPDTVCEILDSAVLNLSKNDLSKILEQCEVMFDFYEIKDYEMDVYRGILASRILAYVRLYRCPDAIKLLRQYRGLGGKGTRQMYLKLLKSMYDVNPVTEEEWRMAKEPDIFARWFLREMLRDGLVLDVHVWCSILRLFNKAGQISFAQGASAKHMDQYDRFMRICLHGHSNLQVAKINMCEEFIALKGENIGMSTGDVNRVVDYFKECETNFPDIKLSEDTHSSVVFSFAYMKGDIASAEQYLDYVHRHLGLPMTNKLTDGIIIGLAQGGKRYEALEYATSVFNQHQIAPKPFTIQKLLQFSLENDDEHEAHRVVNAIRTMYTNEQRLKAFDLRTKDFLVDSAAAQQASEEEEEEQDEQDEQIGRLGSGPEGNPAHTESVDATRQRIKELESKDTSRLSPAEKLSLLRQPELREDVRNVYFPRQAGAKHREKDIIMKLKGLGDWERKEVVWMTRAKREKEMEERRKRRPPFYIRIPEPRQRGGLTDAQLRLRFRAHKMSFERAEDEDSSLDASSGNLVK